MTSYEQAQAHVKAEFVGGACYEYAQAYVDSLYRRNRRTETPLASEFGLDRASASAIRANVASLRPSLFA